MTRRVREGSSAWYVHEFHWVHTLQTVISAFGEGTAGQTNAARMLLVLAHELRGPLMPIRTAAKSLALQLPAGTASRKSVGVIERQLSAIDSIIESVLQAARLDHQIVPIARARVDLGEAVAAAIAAVAPHVSERGHQLSLVPPSNPIHVDGDEHQLGQIVRNLVINAAKYTNRGGRIDIRITARGDMAQISVRDTGIGLAPDKLESISISMRRRVRKELQDQPVDSG